MKIALTGATGFLGSYILRELQANGHSVRAWCRTQQTSQTGGPLWVLGSLNDLEATERLVEGCDAVVHSGIFKPSNNFHVASRSVVESAEMNIIGTLRLMQAARAAGISRFVFISSCAVHDKILSDRKLDETHPTWSASHYGAQKSAIEQFVYSFGLGEKWEICSLRPTGIYGIANPVTKSRWYPLVEKVVRGERVICERGGKEVHASDVARAVSVLLSAPTVAGEVFNCYERYVSEWEVANLAKELSGSSAVIEGAPTEPKNQIDTSKLRGLGMSFGTKSLLAETISAMIATIE